MTEKEIVLKLKLLGFELHHEYPTFSEVEYKHVKYPMWFYIEGGNTYRARHFSGSGTFEITGTPNVETAMNFLIKQLEIGDFKKASEPIHNYRYVPLLDDR